MAAWNSRVAPARDVLVGDDDGDVVTTESEGVVDGGEVTRGQVPRGGGDVDAQVGLQRLHVDGAGAPAPPSRWPVMDLVPLTITDEACSPSALRMEVVSVMSPLGVEVAWALMCLMSVVRRPDSISARFMASVCP